MNNAEFSFNSKCAAVFTNKKVRLNTKLRMYVALILSTLLYGCQTWAITITDMSALKCCSRTACDASLVSNGETRSRVSKSFRLSIAMLYSFDQWKSSSESSDSAG